MKLTQAEMARLLGMPPATWRNWEQGRTAIDALGAAVAVGTREAVLRAMKTRHAA
jgi:putative transcriptional regulator